MLLEKIEKYTQLTLNQSTPIENKAALQSCYFNLKNLKKIVDQNLEHNTSVPKIVMNERRGNNFRKSQTNFRFPDISLSNTKDHSYLKNTTFNTSFRDTKFNKGTFCEEFQCSRGKITSSTQLSLRNENKIDVLNKKLNSIIPDKGSKNNQEKGQKAKKENKFYTTEFRTRKFPKPIAGLAKNQRFFEEKQVKIPKEIVQKIGLYEATNIYKENNVRKFLESGYQNELKPVINLKFATFSLCSRNEFFLTNNNEMPQLEEADPYLDIIKKQNPQPTKEKTQDSANKQQGKKINDSVVEALDQQNAQDTKMESKRNVCWVLNVQNYNLVKNEQYFAFKKENIEDWSEISFILNQITSYLKKVKISLLSFKFNKEIFMREIWSCRKVSEQVLERLLKLRLKIRQKSDNMEQAAKICRVFNSKAEVIRQVVRLWKDRKNLQVMRKRKKKEKDILMWMCLRMVAKHKIRVTKQKVKVRVQTLNSKLKNGDWDYEIQIHIPSFSQSQFVRNTTQYMEYYENMFYHMWKSSNKHFVLILPAINQTILQIFQQKIKFNKNITLICPQAHEQYPKSLPLSACLLYSKEGLAKIRRILDGKKGVIIPGRRSNNIFMYEYYLSEILNCPIFSSLEAPTLLSQIKQLWNKYQVPTSNYRTLQPKCILSTVIEKLSQLILLYPKTKKWIFKMNGQFNGRGIATFSAESKKLKQILMLEDHCQKDGQTKTCTVKFMQRINDEMKQMIMVYLQTHLRLKLRVNFENCIFRVQEYLQKFLQNGGIIEQYLQDCQTYEFCYKLEPGYLNFSHMYILDELEEEKYISCCQNYEVDFVTKSSIFTHNPLPEVLKSFSKIAQKIFKGQKYLGFVSVTVLYDPKKQQLYAVQVKPYMTINSSISYFIKIFNKKGKQVTNRRNANVRHRDPREDDFMSKKELSTFREISSNGLIYIFIPVIVFTDVDQMTRSQIIQNLVQESWQKISNQLFNQSIVVSNPDSFCGSFYLSLGLSLSLLIYGKPFDLKKMKKEAVDLVRQLSQRLETVKLYRGKQQTRDVFQFGDLIRAITKIK